MRKTLFPGAAFACRIMEQRCPNAKKPLPQSTRQGENVWAINPFSGRELRGEALTGAGRSGLSEGTIRQKTHTAHYALKIPIFLPV